jgi:hypothetical protein
MEKPRGAWPAVLDGSVRPVEGGLALSEIKWVIVEWNTLLLFGGAARFEGRVRWNPVFAALDEIPPLRAPIRRWKSEISSVEMTVYHKTLFERT